MRHTVHGQIGSFTPERSGQLYTFTVDTLHNSVLCACPAFRYSGETDAERHCKHQPEIQFGLLRLSMAGVDVTAKPITLLRAGDALELRAFRDGVEIARLRI